MLCTDTELRLRTRPWSLAALVALGLLVLVGLWLRLRGLAAEGFGDDEVHKWLAANRYLQGDLGGDDVEHPMLMKVLIALCIRVGDKLGWAPEAMTRLPNALAGGASIAAVALLGRRLFGNVAGLCAAALAAVSVTLIGYQRVAKEDTLLGVFLLLFLLGLAEAKAAADDVAAAPGDPEASARAREGRRWELFCAAALAGMLASKYFPWLALIAPLFVLSLRRGRAGGALAGAGLAGAGLAGAGLTGAGTSAPVQSAFRPGLRRWAVLVGSAFVIWAALNWTPFLPATWEYARSYTAGQQTVHGSLFFMGRIYHNLVEYGWNGTPPWFYLVFTAVKLAPGTFLLALAGLAVALWERRPAHKLVLIWLAVWFFIHSLSGSKWGRFYTSVLPAFLLLAGHAASLALLRLRALRARALTVPGALLPAGPTRGVAWALPSAGALLLVLAVGGEAQAAFSHAPHQRLYISPLGGGDGNVTWFFPHCDYFDAGFREAVQYVAAHAERGAELSTEIDWPARLYAGQAGRGDLLQTLVRRGRTCRQGRVCYVIVQTGRLYFLNQDAVAFLAGREPWHVERIRGEDVVKVYRLPPGESPYPDENAPAAAAHRLGAGP